MYLRPSRYIMPDSHELKSSGREGVRKIGMTLYGRPHRSTEPRGLDSPVQASPCRDRTVPATKPPVACTVLSKRSTPCRDRTVPATKSPMACTVLSKRLLAGTELSLLRSPPWLAQSCPSVPPPAGTRLSLLRSPPWLAQSCPSVSLQGQDCPCYDGLQEQDSPCDAIFRTPSPP
ncbi:MAG: hypothetical protein KatS3mg020_1117 [Fimbriimonadales bacterium]|nr:MAG: hypothetical protein KatS3mg020_1117 [Fimbriimonadales bacterium]